MHLLKSPGRTHGWGTAGWAGEELSLDAGYGIQDCKGVF